MLTISPEKVCLIAVRAREFDVGEEEVDEDVGARRPDEIAASAVANDDADPIQDEIKAYIDELNEDEQAELVALVWLGREEYAVDEWDRAVQDARDRREQETSDYLLGIPMLADLLEEGLAQFGLSCGEFEIGRM